MANWKEYTTKTTPEDADEIMIADSKANVSKRTPFSGLWNWIAGKLATAVISQLETQNKSIIPALNELNSNVSFKCQVYSKSKINDCNNIPGGTTALAFGSSLNAPIEDGRAAVICIESKADKIKSQYAFGLTTATGIIKSRYCLYNDGEETWTNWK